MRAPALVGARHRLADLVADGAAADEPDALVGVLGAAGSRVQPRAQPLGLGARRGAELAEQRVVEALELPQRRAYVAAVGVPVDQSEVGGLVGRVLGEHVVPALGLAQQARRASAVTTSRASSAQDS